MSLIFSAIASLSIRKHLSVSFSYYTALVSCITCPAWVWEAVSTVLKLKSRTLYVFGKFSECRGILGPIWSIDNAIAWHNLVTELSSKRAGHGRHTNILIAVSILHWHQPVIHNWICSHICLVFNLCETQMGPDALTPSSVLRVFYNHSVWLMSRSVRCQFPSSLAFLWRL